MDSRERECVVDVETGRGGTMKLDSSNKGQNVVLPVKIEKAEKEKQRKSARAKRPPKPPRPPRGLPLDAADQKLIKEIHEFAMIKRARIDRMKALKKLKSVKESSVSSSSTFNGSFLAMFFTLLFFMLLIFQGMSSANDGTQKSGANLPWSPSMAARSKLTKMKEKRSGQFQSI